VRRQRPRVSTRAGGNGRTAPTAVPPLSVAARAVRRARRRHVSRPPASRRVLPARSDQAIEPRPPRTVPGSPAPRTPRHRPHQGANLNRRRRVSLHRRRQTPLAVIGFRSVAGGRDWLACFAARLSRRRHAGPTTNPQSPRRRSGHPFRTRRTVFDLPRFSRSRPAARWPIGARRSALGLRDDERRTVRQAVSRRARAAAGLAPGNPFPGSRAGLRQQATCRWNPRSARAPAESVVVTKTCAGLTFAVTTWISPGGETPTLPASPIVPVKAQPEMS
jgi:hypothetical protein